MTKLTQKTKKAKRNVGKKAALAKNPQETVKATASKTKYGAPSQRPNRKHTGKSVMGDRKYIFQGVMKVDGNGNNIAETSEVTAEGFPIERAEKILAKALARKDVINGRLNYRKDDEKGNTVRSVWVAFTKDNGEIRTTA